MDYNCNNVNFNGRINKNVYKWVKKATKNAIKEEIDKANSQGIIAKQEDIDAIKDRANSTMKLLEKNQRLCTLTPLFT